MDLVSVIIPIYNGSKYIDRAIDSLLSQTYQNLEVILINDGSKDNSENIILRKIEKNSVPHIVFRYFYQENRGISSARNKGLEEATGKFIAFLDQDDWIDDDYIEVLERAIEDFDSDLVIGGFKLLDAQRKLDEWILNPKYEWSKLRITAPWGRIYRKDIIDKYQLRFMETKISEDLYFNLLFLSYSSRVNVISYCGYNWYKNDKSESRTNWNTLSEGRDPIEMLDELHKQMKVPNSLNNDLLTFFFAKYILWYLLYVVTNSTNEMFLEQYKRCIAWLNTNYPRWKKINVCMREPKGERITIRLIVIICILLYRTSLFVFFLSIYKFLVNKFAKRRFE